MKDMAGSHLNNLDLIYSDQDGRVKIYRCWDEEKKKAVCLKEQACETIQEFNILLKEGLNQTSLYHPGICKLYECYLKQEDAQLKCAIVMEWMDRDLQKEIEERHKTESHWAENDLLEAMYILIDALAYAQEQDICHRDLKPNNIFINHSGSVKVGDFGSSIRNLEVEGSVVTSLTETPLYLSPALRANLLATKGSERPSNTLHNPYKSDVYSLGISFLSMAHLQTPQDLSNLELLTQAISASIASIPYTETVKIILRLMLKVDELERPDFFALREKFREVTGFAPTDEALEQQSRKGIFKKCLFCNRVIIQKAGHERFSIVHLECDQRNHVFCSKPCFQTYVRASTLDYRMELSAVICPKKKCKAPISLQFIYDQHDGEAEMRKLIASVLAVHSVDQRSSGSELSPVKASSEEEKPIVESLKCVQCCQVVELHAEKECLKASRQLPYRPVILECEETHVACDRKCFEALVSRATDGYRRGVEAVACPVCQTKVPEEKVYEFFGGKQKYEHAVEASQADWVACNECKENKIEVTLKCGHGFCKMCIRGRYEVYRIQGKRNWLCPVCKEPMHNPGKSLCLLF